MPMHPKRRAGLVDRRVDDERVLLDSQKNLIHKLNPTASAIWDCCDGKTSIDAISEHVAADFGASKEEVEADVKSLIEQLVDIGVLDTDPSIP